MAYSKSFASPEEQYAFKVIDYFFSLLAIKDGEEKLQAAYDGETFCWHFLEGSDYNKSKTALYTQIAEEQKQGIKRSKLHLANALIKLQARAAKDAGIYGRKGVSVVPKRSSKEEAEQAKEILDLEEEDAT